jgi:hypothetical protein
MAKRRFGSAKSKHRARASIQAMNMRYDARAVSENAKRGLCGPALTELIAVARSAGALRAENQGYDSRKYKIGIGGKLLRTLRNKVNACYIKAGWRER